MDKPRTSHDTRRQPGLVVAPFLLLSLACSASKGPGSSTGGQGLGGIPSTGGAAGRTSGGGGASGGATASSSGGATSTRVTGGSTTTSGGAGGAESAAGGTAGGNTGSGGSSSAGGGGGTSSGGANGGAGGAGGRSSGSGGASGGAGGMTGPSSAGGSAATGGASRTGGSGGINNAGGSAAAGGASGNGGSSATGGSPVGGWFKCSDLTTQKLTTEYAAWKTSFVVACGTDKARVNQGGNTTVSEGIGYGMLIAAGMRDCALLKQLNKFYSDAQNFTNASNNSTMKGSGLMPWRVTSGCDTTTVDDANFASDGDLDAAMGLLQGDAVCPDQGSYPYKAGAVAIINALKKNAFITSNGKSILRAGGLGNSINPSYFATGYFRAFAKATPENASFWQQAVTDAYALLASYQSEMSGKWPDWGTADGHQAGGWGYDACRVPWRIATDFAWSSAPEAKTLLDKFRTTGMNNQLPYAATDQHNSAFVGAMALSAVSADQTTMNSFCSDWLSRQNGFGNGGLDDSPYFQGTLRLVYMMLASGAAVSTL